MSNSDGLLRMRLLLDELGNPEKNFKIIHIAGTNGKGSTAFMTASILEEAGYSVGLYTSPHVMEIYERMQLWDGEHHLIKAGDFNRFDKEVSDAFLKVKEKNINQNLGDSLHLFERWTAIAYLYFWEHKPDYVILEVGLGGRLDSTNTIQTPLVTAITQIGLDHTAELGRTIFKIAEEKAGIIKEGVPVVSQTMDLGVKNILKRHAKLKNAEFIDVSLIVNSYRRYELGMRGDYQYENAATAVEAIRAAGIEISDVALSSGLKKACYMARFEILSDNPYIIIDGAHNIDAVRSFTENYSRFAILHKIKKTLLIFGVMKDKNYARMIKLLSQNIRNCTFSTVTIQDKRAEDGMVLAKIFTEIGRDCICFDSLKEAYSYGLSKDYDSILVTGSIYLAGDMKKLFLNERK